MRVGARQQAESLLAGMHGNCLGRRPKQMLQACVHCCSKTNDRNATMCIRLMMLSCANQGRHTSTRLWPSIVPKLYHHPSPPLLWDAQAETDVSSTLHSQAAAHMREGCSTLATAQVTQEGPRQQAVFLQADAKGDHLGRHLWVIHQAWWQAN